MDQNDIINHIFDKEVTCPICKNTFKTTAVKVNSPRIASKDSDFFLRYSVVNPYFYDVWICNTCGYSAMKSDFPKVKNYERDLVVSNITNRWRKRDYPKILDAATAVERYKLALLNATVMNKSNGTLGMILLKIAWMYRLIEENNDAEPKNESEFIQKALSALSEAYSTEDFPIYGLQRDSFTYLLGDLNRRLGNDSEALRWYSSVITSPSSSVKIKELARDGKEMLQKQAVVEH